MAQIYILKDTTIDYQITTGAWIGKDPFGDNASPTVTIEKGASTGPLQAFNASGIDMNGGGVNEIILADTSSFTMTGGGIVDGVYAQDKSQVTMQDGDLQGTAINSQDSAKVLVRNGILGGVISSGHSTAEITAGLLGEVGAHDSAHITMEGGNTDTAVAFDHAVFTLAGGEVLGDAGAFAGGDIGLYSGAVTGNISGNEDSTVDINGADIGGSVMPHEYMQVFLYSGSVAKDMQTPDHTIVSVGGGTVAGDLVASGSGEAYLAGGTIDGDVYAKDTSTVYINGGTVLGDLYEYGGSIVNLSGGSVDGPAGPLGWYLYDSSLLRISGLGLRDTLLDPNFGGMFSEYSLAGVLTDGTNIDGKRLFVQNGAGAGFQLLNGAPGAVPEPGTIVLFLSASLTLVPLVRRSRRQRR